MSAILGNTALVIAYGLFTPLGVCYDAHIVHCCTFCMLAASIFTSMHNNALLYADVLLNAALCAALHKNADMLLFCNAHLCICIL